MNNVQEFKVEELSIDTYSNRRGYNPDFIGQKIPLPVESNKIKEDAAKLKDNSGIELKYNNFSVIMSKSRNLAIITAVNIDGSSLENLPRDKDVWYYDPRMDKEHQYGPELYANNDLDRGHLVRRLDPVWGSLAKIANEDTFHFSNCSPQHKNLNQKIWLDLEDYILKNTDLYDLKVNVFTGPIFRPDDVLYRNKFQIPAEFWKVVSMKTKVNKISATAYIQTQKNLLIDLEFAFGGYKTYQIPISIIENLTGLNFGNLRTFDPLATLEGEMARVIKDPSDITI
jgi:endonuclease G, mitochondrial